MMASRADQGFEVRGGTIGIEKIEKWGGGGLWIYFKYTIIITILYQKILFENILGGRTPGVQGSV